MQSRPLIEYNNQYGLFRAETPLARHSILGKLAPQVQLLYLDANVLNVMPLHRIILGSMSNSDTLTYLGFLDLNFL